MAPGLRREGPTAGRPGLEPDMPFALRRRPAPVTLAVLAAVVPLTALAVDPPRALAQGPPAAETAQAETAEAEKRAAERERLFVALARAQTEGEARTLAHAIWRFWFEPPNAEAGALMDRALARIRRRDYAGAIRVLDALVVLAPDWAEAWNQRATVRFLRGNYDGSLADIERVLALEPKHFGALAGQALILIRIGRVGTGRAVLRQALRVHPFLAERRLLMPAEREERRL